MQARSGFAGGVACTDSVHTTLMDASPRYREFAIPEGVSDLDDVMIRETREGQTLDRPSADRPPISLIYRWPAWGTSPARTSKPE
jgi:hypothetical protein